MKASPKTKGKWLFCIMGAILFSTNPLLATNWGDLEKELGTQTRSKGFEQITNQQFVKGLIQTRDTAVLTEMCFQSGRPLVITAGFLGLKGIAPEESYPLALRIAWNDDQPADFQILFQYVYFPLSQKVDYPALDSALSYIMQSPPKNRLCVVGVIGSIGRQTLERWLMEGSHNGCVPSNIAFLIETCCEDPAWRKKLPDGIKSILLEYSKIPGPPRVAYLECYQDTDQHFIEVLNDTIGDEAISDQDLATIIGTRQTLVQSLLEKGRIPLSDKPRKRLMETLKSFKRRTPQDSP